MPQELSMTQYLLLTGIQPEIDVDGDGLETIDLDSNAEIFQCHDGDGSLIEGAYCLEDPRIADGFGMCLDMHGIPGELVYPLDAGP